MWIQDKVERKEIKLGRVPTEDNEADIGTKYLDAEKIRKFLKAMSMRVLGGRSAVPSGPAGYAVAGSGDLPEKIE